ncbi:hypothetical protein [Nocardiopsis quinghaiensis]|uniref:hypothetical protein n=1 Tax=Nocardiopsis quinghaiensis TaxID=464995 RepID=UPI001239E4EC|nr:hypothetical protein [Nocardiopsis quinghaiensis]
MTSANEHEHAYLSSLKRHFADLRDGTHGGAATRKEKEELFHRAVELLAPYANVVLAEVDHTMLLETGTVEEGGVRRTPDGGLAATWALSWPEQRAVRIPPISIIAHYGGGFHHPHVRGATVTEWPLNVFTAGQAAAEVPLLRSIAAGDLHNLVFRADYRIVPATVRREGE